MRGQSTSWPSAVTGNACWWWSSSAAASDVVVGQILRYMGYVKEQISEPHQSVEGAIIALDDDQKLRWALLAVPASAFTATR